MRNRHTHTETHVGREPEAMFPSRAACGRRTHMASVVRLLRGVGLGLANEPALTYSQFGADPRVFL